MYTNVAPQRRLGNFQQYISPQLHNLSFQSNDLETDSDLLMEISEAPKTCGSPDQSRLDEIAETFLKPFPDHSKYREIRSKIANNLKKKDVKNLVFLTNDLVAHGEVDDVDHGYEVIEQLEDRGLVRWDDTLFLAELLSTIRRIDLVKLLVDDVPGWKTFNRGTTLQLSAYRKMLYEVAEDLTSRDSKQLASLLKDNDVPKAARDAVTDSLDLLTLMENHGILEEDSLDVLKSMLLLAGHDSTADILEAGCASDAGASHKIRQQSSLVSNQTSQTHAATLRDGGKSGSRRSAPNHNISRSIRQPQQPARSSIQRLEAAREAPAAASHHSPGQLPEYQMKAKPRGFCVIINNMDFVPATDDSQPLGRREGSHVDCRDLENLFHKLFFNVVVYENLTSVEMVQVMIDFAVQRDHGSMDCFVCCILTHGRKDGVYGVDGRLLYINDITNHFKGLMCPSLSGKPKLFFIQACQGRDKQPGIPLHQRAGNWNECRPAIPQNNDIETDGPRADTGPDVPNEADLLLYYATVPGYVSYRSKSQGSWFINALVKNLDKYHNQYDVATILSNVNSEVAQQAAPIDGGLYKQIPMYHTTLRKRIFFAT